LYGLQYQAETKTRENICSHGGRVVGKAKRVVELGVESCGKTALSEALKGQHDAIAKLLKEKGAN